MHRSGTSAVARVVNLLGVDLGPAEDMMETKPRNPEGFWENHRIVRLNDDLLALLGGRWDEPLVHEIDRVPGINDFRASAAEIISDFHGNRPGFKDPRASLLLRFWFDVWPDAKVVVCVRDPRSVGTSLARRDGFDEEKSAALWMRYTWESLAAVSDPVLVLFEDLVSDPAKVVNSLATSLALSPTDAALRAAIASIKTDRPSAGRELANPISPVLSLAVQLCELLPGASQSFARIVAAGIREPEIVSRLIAAEESVETLHRQTDQFHEELKIAQSNFRAARAEADRLEVAATGSLEALVREERARQRLEALVAEKEGEVHGLAAELAWRRAIQYRLERVLGQRGLEFLSGYREDK